MLSNSQCTFPLPSIFHILAVQFLKYINRPESMKKVLILFFCTSVLTFSQSNYYNGTKGLFGDNLKLCRHNKIKGHSVIPNSSGSTHTWDSLKQRDRDPSNPANVILIYTGFSVNAAQGFNNGNGWNREHVWAKSHGFPSKSDTAHTDCHHLHPSNIAANSARGNLDFDNGGSEYFSGSTATGNYFDGNSWEPRDAVKGDVARSMLYMTVRYENKSKYDLELVDRVGTASGSPTFGKKSTLLEWNRIDPPDDFERNRNDVVYGYQKNRNPFIDHPEYADRIYNSDKFIIENVESISFTEMVVTFSQDVDSMTAVKVENYNLTDAGAPVFAEYGYNSNNNSVFLRFSSDLTDDVYILSAAGIESNAGEPIIEDSLASVEIKHTVEVEAEFTVPSKVQLLQNFPNPFNPSTTIKFRIPDNGAVSGIVSLKVYDITGELVADLVNGQKSAGEYSVMFDASKISSGIYFYKVSSGGNAITKKMILLR